MHHDLNTLWWYIARAAGVTAWCLSASAVWWGLMISSRAGRGRVASGWLLDLHRYLGALTGAFVVLHVAALEADASQPHIRLLAVAVPMASRWRPVAVSWGVAALWLLLAIEITSLLMDHIPRRWWRAVHFTSFAVFGLTTVHVLAAGTDWHNPVVQWAALFQVVVFVFLIVYRLLDRTVGIERPRPAALARR